MNKVLILFIEEKVFPATKWKSKNGGYIGLSYIYLGDQIIIDNIQIGRDNGYVRFLVNGTRYLTLSIESFLDKFTKLT